MDTFVESLPIVSNGTIRLIEASYESNVMSTKQVAAAKAKGWVPYYYENGWKEYAGSDYVVEKCATPTINFSNGKLSFDCETEDVEFVFTATPPSKISGSGNDIYLSSKYVVTVYAKKDGYEDSDVATKEIEAGAAAGIKGDVNGDEEVGMPDIMYIVQYLLNGKFPDE